MAYLGVSSRSTTSMTSILVGGSKPTLMVDDNNGVVSDDREPEHDPQEHEHGHWRSGVPVGLRFFSGTSGRRHSAHAAVVAVHCASGAAQVYINNIKDNNK